MTTTETRIEAITKELNEHISYYTSLTEEAMLTLEHMKASAREYKEANRAFAMRTFVSSYLTRIKGVVETRDIKSAENIIRYHSYYQHTKGNLGDGSDIAVAQSTVAVILDGIIAKYFD